MQDWNARSDAVKRLRCIVREILIVLWRGYVLGDFVRRCCSIVWPSAERSRSGRLSPWRHAF